MLNEKMKALRFVNDTLELSEIAKPENNSEVLIRVVKSGICNTDLEIVRGYAGFSGTIGHEFVGVVESSPEAPEWIGKRVVGEINAGCGVCAKCVFTAIITAPFLARAQAKELFGADVLDNPDNLALGEELAGFTDAKPWECVGTISEVSAALAHLGADPEWREAHLVEALSMRVRERDGLVLELGAVAGGEADLAERVVKATLLGQLRELAIVVDVPARALLDVADDEAAADVRHPVGEFDVGLLLIGLGHLSDLRKGMGQAVWASGGEGAASERELAN